MDERLGNALAYCSKRGVEIKSERAKSRMTAARAAKMEKLKSEIAAGRGRIIDRSGFVYVVRCGDFMFLLLDMTDMM